MKKTTTLLILSLVSWHYSGNCQPPAHKGYVLLFEDQFVESKVNEAHWRYRLGRRTGGGYINGLNLKENVYIRDSTLHIACKHEMIDGDWENTGGGLISTHNFGYGYYECLSKPFMGGKGVHTSFWQRGGARPNNNLFEIDGYEIDSKVWMAANNLYVDLAPKGLKYSPWPHRMGVPFTTDKNGWLLDAYELTPEGVIFYDNGKVVAKAEWPELNVQQTVWLSALNGVGKVDTAALPGASLFKYFRYYAKDYPGISILPNGNFEYNANGHDLAQPLCWLASGSKEALSIVEGAAHSGDYKLKIGNGKDHENTLHQTIEYIMDGSYLLSAMIRSSGGQKTARIKVSDHGGKPLFLIIPASDTWRKISIPVSVNSHKASFTIEVTGKREQWLEIDDIQFMKPLPAGNKMVQPTPMFPKNAPIWQFARKEPVYFPGDARFFFFDRNVGYGNAITVSLNITAEQLANTTPIARMPKAGDSGWGIQLTKTGGLLFKIGSAADQSNLRADDIYRAGIPVKITCTFENGTASIYKNDTLVLQQVGIRQHTLDQTAPGKLGTVGKEYEAVGEVTVQTGNRDQESDTMKNFRGTIRNLRIYNRIEIH